MSDQANVALVLRVYDEFGRGDIPAVLTRLDPQADLNFEGPSTIPWAGNWHGREGWAKFFQAVGENPRRHHVDHGTVRGAGRQRGSGRTVSGARQVDRQADRFAAGASVDHPQWHGRTVSGTDQHCGRSGGMYGGSCTTVSAVQGVTFRSMNSISRTSLEPW